MDGDVAEDIVEKPSSQAKKPPSVTSRTRASARSKPVLKSLPETEEEEQPIEDSPPPVKRRRGVAKEHPAAVNDYTTQQDPPSRKGRSAAGSRTSTNTSRARTSVVVKDEEDDVEEVPVPTRRSTRSSIPPKPEPSSFVVPSEKSKKQPVRSGRKPVVVSDNDSDIVEISAAEATSSKSKTRTSTSRKSNSQAGPSKVPVKQKSPSSAPIPESEPEPEPEPEPVNDHPLGAQDDGPPPTALKPSPKKAPPPPVAESDEEPLIEQPPARIPTTQPPPPAPEEPEGVRPRLVIHKIALVNFKSYAGRQEIGPFHKVGSPPYTPSTGLTPVFSHSLRLSAPMGPESLTPLMRSCLFLDTEPRKCAKRNCLNSSITRTSILTSNNAV